jgi:hypothetical protein
MKFSIFAVIGPIGLAIEMPPFWTPVGVLYSRMIMLQTSQDKAFWGVKLEIAIILQEYRA